MVFKNNIKDSILVLDKGMHVQNNTISALSNHVFCKNTPKMPELKFAENKNIPNKYIQSLSSKNVNSANYFTPDYETSQPNGMYIASTKKTHTLVYAKENSKTNINKQYVLPFIDVLTRNSKKTTIISVNSQSIFKCLKQSDSYFKLLKKRGYELNLVTPNSHKQKFIDFTRQAYKYYKQNNYVKFKVLMSEIETLLFGKISAQDPMWTNAAKSVFELGALMYFDHVQNINQVSLVQIVDYIKALLTTTIDTNNTYSFIQDIVNKLDPDNKEDLTIFDVVMFIREQQDKHFYESNILAVKITSKSIAMLHAVYGVTLVMMLSNIYYLAKYLGSEKLESMFYDLDNPNSSILELVNMANSDISKRYLDYVLNVINQNQVENSKQNLYLILNNASSNYQMPDLYKTIKLGTKYNELVTLILPKDEPEQFNKIYQDIQEPDQFLKQNFGQTIIIDQNGESDMPFWTPDNIKLNDNKKPIDFKKYYQEHNPDSPNLHKGMSNLFDRTISGLFDLADDQINKKI